MLKDLFLDVAESPVAADSIPFLVRPILEKILFQILSDGSFRCGRTLSACVKLCRPPSQFRPGVFMRFHHRCCSLLSSLALLIAILLLAGTSAAQRPITVDDYFKIREVHDPQLSPDGKWIAYSVKTPLLKEDKNEERIWMTPAVGGEAVALTAEHVSSSHPRWSPDGKYIAFLSARSDSKQQVWLLNRLGGEAERLTYTPQDVDEMEWSPDSTRLGLLLRDASREELEDFQDQPDKDNDQYKDKDKEKDAKEKKSKTARPWVIDRRQFKQDEIGYLDRRRTHLYIFDLAKRSLTQVTSGDFDDDQLAWSPDGKRLAFSSNRSMPDPDASYNTDIWTVTASNTDKGAHITQVTKSPGEDREPSWSPDGKWITYTTRLDPAEFEYGTKHLAVISAGGGEPEVLTRTFDRMVINPRFSPDGKFVYFIADDDGTQNLCRIPVKGGEIERPVGGRLMVNAYALAKTGEVAAQVATIDRPDEIFTIPGGKLTQVSHTNDALFAQLKISHGEYVHFKSKDGTTVAGYLYKPLDYTPGKKVPTILRPHGGPVWAYYAEFAHLPQLFAANGYAVLFPNPRGSTGYGQKHAQAIFADWGNKDFQDDMAMVDYAVEQGIADPEKLGVGGWSYGGISTNFIITQTTRFKAAISGAGEFLYMTNYGHDHYQRDWETELGRPWEKKELYEKLSPFYRLTNITTPTLIMGGNIDWNVPIINGEQMYQALKSLGRTTELVVYPDEYHEFSTPSHIKDRLDRYMAWYNHYVKGDSAPARPPESPAK
jgi:dipeptidyl aminopeptidase/acylaminoacyl peptidase